MAPASGALWSTMISGGEGCERSWRMMFPKSVSRALVNPLRRTRRAWRGWLRARRPAPLSGNGLGGYRGGGEGSQRLLRASAARIAVVDRDADTGAGYSRGRSFPVSRERCSGCLLGGARGFYRHRLFRRDAPGEVCGVPGTSLSPSVHERSRGHLQRRERPARQESGRPTLASRPPAVRNCYAARCAIGTAFRSNGMSPRPGTLLSASMVRLSSRPAIAKLCPF